MHLFRILDPELGRCLEVGYGCLHEELEDIDEIVLRVLELAEELRAPVEVVGVALHHLTQLSHLVHHREVAMVEQGKWVL